MGIKKACSNSEISRWLGAYVSACQQTWGLAAKSPFKGSLSKGAYLNVLVFLCSSTFAVCTQKQGHDLIRLSWFVFVLLSLLWPLLCVLPSSFLSHLCPIAASALCSPVTPLFCRTFIAGLSSFKKTPHVSVNLKMTHWHLKWHD